MRTKKLGIFAFMVFLLYFGVFTSGVFTENKVTVVYAEPFEAGDFVSYLDAEARNITYAVAPATAALAEFSPSNIYSLDKVLVRASTFPYSVLEDDEALDFPVMHNAKPEFLRAYYQTAQLTGEYRINQLASLLEADNIQNKLKTISNAELASIQSALSLMAEVNDTAQSSGYVASGTEKFAIEDISDADNAGLNISDTSSVIFSASLATEYQGHSSALSGNTSETDFIKASKVDDKERYTFAVSGFDDMEEDGFLVTLRANLAANHSTASDQVTPSRITILDYTAYGLNLTNFQSKIFNDRIRDAVDEYDAELASTTAYLQSTVNVWGHEIRGPMKVIPVSAALDLNGLGTSIGKVYTVGKVLTSTPLTRIERKVEGLSGITPTASTDIGGASVRSALTKINPVTKGGLEWESNYNVQIVSEGIGKPDWAYSRAIANSKFSDDSFTTINAAPRSYTDWIMENIGWIALFSGIGLLVVIIIVWNYKFRGPVVEEVRPY